MIESIYILDTASASLILQHSYTGRLPPPELLEYFQSLLRDEESHAPLPAIIPVPPSTMALDIPTTLFQMKSSNRNILIFTTITAEPHDAVAVMEFLQRVIQVLDSYFGKDKMGRGLIEANFDIVEELLCEMADSGEVLTTEPDALRDIVLPPSLLNKLMSAAGLQGYLMSRRRVTEGLMFLSERCRRFLGDAPR
jgi:AP-3 complex subunit mu